MVKKKFSMTLKVLTCSENILANEWILFERYINIYMFNNTYRALISYIAKYLQNDKHTHIQIVHASFTYSAMQTHNKKG